MLQLQEVQEQGARLAKHNAILERELREACQSLSGMERSADPSTSVAFVEGPMIVDLGGTV